MKKLRSKRVAYILLLVFAFAGIGARAQIATGGTYTLEQSVIANGGRASSGGTYEVEGTHGQVAAGANPASGIYSLRSGYWNPLMIAPTAANVAVSGRVITAEGSGIRNVIVSISGGPLSTPRMALSSSFGHFVFDDIEVGHTYVISVSSKRFGFAQPTRAISVVDNITDITFTASTPN